MRRHRSIAVSAAAVIVSSVTALVLALSGNSGRAATPIPPSLNILSAEIVEQPPIDPEDAAARAVLIRLVVEAAPDCASATSPLSYGVLVDADRKPKTGTTVPGISTFGADARITAACSGGVLTSPGRTVQVSVDGGTGQATIEIATTVGELPSVQLRWAPYAMSGDQLFHVRAPAWAEWTTSERTMP